MKLVYFLGFIALIVVQLISGTHQTQCDDVFNDAIKDVYELTNKTEVGLVHITHVYADGPGGEDDLCLLMQYNKDHCGAMFFHSQFIIPPEDERYEIKIISSNKMITAVWRTTLELIRKEGTEKHIYKVTLTNLEKLGYVSNNWVRSSDFEAIPINQSIKNRFNDFYVSILEIGENENIVGFATCEKNNDDPNKYLCDKAGWIMKFHYASYDNRFWNSIIRNNRFTEIITNELPLVEPY